MLKEQTQHQLGHPGPPLSGLLSQRCVAPTDARLNRARLAALLFRSPITGHDVWGEGEAKGAAKGNRYRSAELTTTRPNYRPVIITPNLDYAPVLTPDEKIPASDESQARRPHAGGNQPPKVRPEPGQGDGRHPK